MGCKLPRYDEIPYLRWRLVDDVGFGFVLGTSCGGALYFRSAARTSPHGGLLALAAGANAARVNAPLIAGALAAYFGLRHTFASAMYLARGKDDRWNYVAGAGARAIWGLVSLPLGGRAAVASTLMGAAGAALLEGALFVFRSTMAIMPSYLELCPPRPPSRCVAEQWPPLPVPAAHRPTPHGFIGIRRQSIVIEEVLIDDRP
ncbi:hypothetical protein ACP4OV_012671 [Aristida adscensionis]